MAIRTLILPGFGAFTFDDEVTPTPTLSFDGDTEFTKAPSSDNHLVRLVDLEGGAHNIPAGGTTGQVLVKASDDDYDLEWRTIHELPSGGLTGQVLTKQSDSDYDVIWVTP